MSVCVCVSVCVWVCVSECVSVSVCVSECVSERCFNAAVIHLSHRQTLTHSMPSITDREDGQHWTAKLNIDVFSLC